MKATGPHLFKNLDGLVPGVALGSLLGQADVEKRLAPVAGASGLSLGQASPVSGIRLELARAKAEAAGARVLGEIVERQAGGTAPAPAPAPSAPPAAPAAAPRALPHTGGLPLGDAPWAVPTMFGGSTALITLRGNVAVAGHRTTYGKPFADLDRLHPGDEIVFDTPVGRSTYRVSREPYVVGNSDWSPIAQTPGSTLTLSTCHPKTSDRQRLIVKAELVGPDQ